MCFASIGDSFVSASEVSVGNAFPRQTANRARFCVGHALKDQSFDRIEQCCCDAGPSAELSVIKFSWDETPQRVALAPTELEDLLGQTMWERVQDRAGAVAAIIKTISGWL